MTIFGIINVARMTNLRFHGMFIISWYTSPLKNKYSYDYFSTKIFRYKLNIVGEDFIGVANFIVFGRMAKQLIDIAAVNLATDSRCDHFTLPVVTKKYLAAHIYFKFCLVTRVLMIPDIT